MNQRKDSSNFLSVTHTLNSSDSGKAENIASKISEKFNEKSLRRMPTTDWGIKPILFNQF